MRNRRFWLTTLTLTALLGLSAIAASCDDDAVGDAPPAEPTYATKVEDAPIDELDVLTLESFPPQYNVRIASGLPSGCAVFDKAQRHRSQRQDHHLGVMNTMPDDAHARLHRHLRHEGDDARPRQRLQIRPDVQGGGQRQGCRVHSAIDGRRTKRGSSADLVG